jgi:predicted nucleic acid-binding protein
MNGGLTFLDVNIPMYAAGQLHLYKDSCTQVMQAVADGQIAAAIDTEIIQEILYRYGALRRWEVATAMAADVLTLASVVYPISVEDIRLTVNLFASYAIKGVTARDLIHVAVMKTNSLTEIISVDNHFDLVEGITRIDPADYVLRSAT